MTRPKNTAKGQNIKRRIATTTIPLGLMTSLYRRRVASDSAFISRRAIGMIKR